MKYSFRHTAPQGWWSVAPSAGHNQILHVIGLDLVKGNQYRGTVGLFSLVFLIIIVKARENITSETDMTEHS